MFTYLVQTVNNMYQNVSGKSIENQELILGVFLLCLVNARSGCSLKKELPPLFIKAISFRDTCVVNRRSVDVYQPLNSYSDCCPDHESRN